MLCQLSLTQGKRLKLVGELVKSELKGKGFRRLCDAKPVRQNELYANILIELNNNVTVKNSNTNIGNVISLSWYSSFEKLINVTCFVFCFLKNFSCKMKKQNQCFKEESVSKEEHKEAINQWILFEQACLCQQPNFQKLFLSLNLFEDCQNILRLKGRFGNSLLEYDQKYPVILHGYESLFTRLLMVDAH